MTRKKTTTTFSWFNILILIAFLFTMSFLYFFIIMSITTEDLPDQKQVVSSQNASLYFITIFIIAIIFLYLVASIIMCQFGTRYEWALCTMTTINKRLTIDAFWLKMYILISTLGGFLLSSRLYHMDKKYTTEFYTLMIVNCILLLPLTIITSAVILFIFFYQTPTRNSIFY